MRGCWGRQKCGENMVFVKKHAKPFCWVGKRAERQLLPPRPSSPRSEPTGLSPAIVFLGQNKQIWLAQSASLGWRGAQSPLLGLGQAKLGAGVFLESFLFRGTNPGTERSGTLPAALPRGVGRPSERVGEGARYLSRRFAGRASKFFSKYSPGAAARLAAPPCALHAAQGDKRDPDSREETGTGRFPGETRVEAAGPIPIALRLPWTPSRVIFWGANGFFWSLLPCCHLRSLPRGRHRPPCSNEGQDLFSYPHPSRGIPSPDVLAGKCLRGERRSVQKCAPLPRGGRAAFGRDTPPFPSEFPSWSETWAGGRRQRLGGIWGEGTLPARSGSLQRSFSQR